MSWEEDYRDERPCFCGKGTIVSWSRSNDWGQSQSGEDLVCVDCKQKYVYAFVDPYSAYRLKTNGYRWLTKEQYAEYQKQEQEEKAKEKEIRIQELQRLMSEWKGRHTLKWFEAMDQYMRLQGKHDTQEYKAMLEEFHQYEAKLDARNKGYGTPRRPSIGRTHYWHED